MPLQDITNLTKNQQKDKNKPKPLLPNITHPKKPNHIQWQSPIKEERDLRDFRYPQQVHNTETNTLIENILNELKTYDQHHFNKFMKYMYNKVLDKLKIQARDIFPTPEKYTALNPSSTNVKPVPRHKSKMAAQRRNIIQEKLTRILNLLQMHLPKISSNDTPMIMLKKAVATVIHEMKEQKSRSASTEIPSLTQAFGHGRYASQIRFTGRNITNTVSTSKRATDVSSTQTPVKESATVSLSCNAGDSCVIC